MFISLVRLIRNFAALDTQPTRKNQRVRLISQGRKASSENPITGTRYECEGTVIFVDKDAIPLHGTSKVSVSWDNERKNIYNQYELNVSDLPCNPHPYYFKPNFTKSNPNYTFKERKASLKYYEERGEHKSSINDLIMRSSRGKATWL